MTKRIFDFILALTGIAILSPLLLLIAVLIYKRDGFPILFKQTRVGKDGKHFKILKFRTMVRDAEKMGLQLTVGGNDPRIMPIGRWLRKYKLDELPQLFNVLFGEMSFVGPRPEVPHYVALYNDQQKKVLSVRPGITDKASIAYRNENELLANISSPEKYYIEHIMPDKLKLNLEYISEQSLLTDIKLILKTLKVI